jgi:hypothetical protein
MKHKTLHEKVEWLFESGDLRLIYGMAVPLLAAVGLITAFAIVGEWWLLPPLMFVVLALTAVVIIGFSQMLDDDSGDEQ